MVTFVLTTCFCFIIACVAVRHELMSFVASGDAFVVWVILGGTLIGSMIVALQVATNEWIVLLFGKTLLRPPTERGSDEDPPK
jgi:hypothetical protein